MHTCVSFTVFFLHECMSRCACVFQNAVEKDAVVEVKHGPPQKAPPQGCLQYILDCNGVAVGPKLVQAN